MTGPAPLRRPDEVAQLLGVSRQTVYNLVHAGELSAVSFNTRGARKTIRFRDEDVQVFVERHLGQPE